MLQSINAIANALICLGGLAFYVMLFTKIGDGVKQIDQFGKVSYHVVRTGLAFIVAGALFNVLLLTTPPVSEVLMNLGFGLVLSWAAVWHTGCHSELHEPEPQPQHARGAGRQGHRAPRGRLSEREGLSLVASVEREQGQLSRAGRAGRQGLHGCSV